MLTKICRTCWQPRPESDFIHRGEGQLHSYKCRVCRIREQAPAIDADKPEREAGWLAGSALLATTMRAWNLSTCSHAFDRAAGLAPLSMRVAALNPHQIKVMADGIRNGREPVMPAQTPIGAAASHEAAQVIKAARRLR